MLSEDSARNKIIKAAFRLAENERWADISLGSIAKEAFVPLSDLYQEFQHKKDILKAFSIAVNASALKIIEQEGSEADETPKDRLFDILMTRFEVMEPYKKALKKIYEDMKKGYNLDSISLSHLWNTSEWLLEAADIRPAGRRKLLRTGGLSALQAKMLPVWLDDKDPGLAKTMSELDKRLKDGEKWLAKADRFIDKGKSLLCSFRKKSEPKEKNTEDSSGTPA